MNSNLVNRIRIILGLVAFAALIIITRLYFIQVIKGNEYRAKADGQYVKEQDKTLDRGTIFFQNKAGDLVSAATMKEGYTLVLNPKLIKDAPSTYEALSQYVDLDRMLFMDKAAKTNDQYEELKKKLDSDTGTSINSLRLPGVNAIKEDYRVYPAGSLASQTIGLIGFDSSNQVAGRYGIERFYEETLKRKDKPSDVNFFAALFTNVKDTLFSSGGATKEGDVITSIDSTVESVLERTLEETQNTWNSDSIGGIIMDPKNGEIYAMASRPTFDGNNLNEVKDPKVFSNSLVENVYEMGSIIKPLTIATGIDTGVVTPNSTYDDKGFLLLNSKRISNYDGKARGVITVQEILNQSLNVGAATVAMKVGNDAFTKYFLSFGLGEKTGIDQPNEQKGIVDNLNSGRDIEHATASYGQGIAMSPIATVRALAILANKGKLVWPHVVKKIQYLDETEKDVTGDEKQVIKEDTALTVTNMLTQVVDKAISKQHPGISMEHYSIAAKTGTAQIADHVNGGYYADRYLHSFFGYFPAYNPKVIVFLYQVYPKGAEYASQTLTDPFISLAKFLISYYEIPPDR